MRRIKVTRSQVDSFLKDVFASDEIDEITDEWLAEAGERLRQRLLSHPDLETREMWKRVINRTPSASEGGTNKRG